MARVAAAFFVVAAATLSLTGSAGAITCAEDPAYCEDVVGGTDFNRTTTEPQTRVEGVTVTRGQELPVTGGDIVGLVMIGAASVGAGAALVRASRRSRQNVA